MNDEDDCRPIDSAPTDGRDVRLVFPDGSEKLGCYIKDDSGHAGWVPSTKPFELNVDWLHPVGWRRNIPSRSFNM